MNGWRYYVPHAPSGTVLMSEFFILVPFYTCTLVNMARENCSQLVDRVSDLLVLISHLYMEHCILIWSTVWKPFANNRLQYHVRKMKFFCKTQAWYHEVNVLRSMTWQSYLTAIMYSEFITWRLKSRKIWVIWWVFLIIWSLCKSRAIDLIT